MISPRIISRAVLIQCLLASSSFAEEVPNYYEETLTRDWGGKRSSLYSKGIDLTAAYKFDIMGNTSGGLKQEVRALDNLDVIVTFDGEKLFGSTGTSAVIHFLNNNGGRPDVDLVGSAQGINNIEVPHATGKLFQAYVQQNFLEDKISLLAGLYDLNSEFYVNEPSLLFIHSAYGIGTEMALSGENGPSIFPFSALAARLKVQPTANTYVQAAVLDGVAGDPNNDRGTQIHLRSSDGVLSVLEAGLLSKENSPKGKVAVGGWYYTDTTPNIMNGANEHNYGFYLIADHSVYQEQGSSTQGLAVFGRIGFANEDVNQFDYAWNAGLVYTGLIPSRDEGQLGLGVAVAHNSKPFKRAAALASTPVDTAEIAVEITYSDPITPWLFIQPDIQYIINPSTDPSIDNALILGSRFIVNF